MSLKHRILAIPRWLVMSALGPLERRLLRTTNCDNAVVFIIGAPRSGTTLLYEALVTRFEFAYFANIAHRAYRTPAAATRLGRGPIRRWRGAFQSNYGHIRGWGSPSEGGWIWRRWIGDETTLQAADAERIDSESMRRTVHAVADALDAPFLNKNVMHSVHMGLLHAVFPNALFIECRRDPLTNARSLIRARLDAFGDDGVSKWLSVRPDGWEQSRDTSAGAQVVAQIFLTRRQIDSSMAAIGDDRRVIVEYEQLCSDPNHVMAEIEAFLSAGGVTVRSRGELPQSFAPSPSRATSKDFESEMAAAIQEWSDPTSGRSPALTGAQR